MKRWNKWNRLTLSLPGAKYYEKPRLSQPLQLNVIVPDFHNRWYIDALNRAIVKLSPKLGQCNHIGVQRHLSKFACTSSCVIVILVSRQKLPPTAIRNTSIWHLISERKVMAGSPIEDFNGLVSLSTASMTFAESFIEDMSYWFTMYSSSLEWHMHDLQSGAYHGNKRQPYQEYLH